MNIWVIIERTPQQIGDGMECKHILLEEVVQSPPWKIYVAGGCIAVHWHLLFTRIVLQHAAIVGNELKRDYYVHCEQDVEWDQQES